MAMASSHNVLFIHILVCALPVARALPIMRVEDPSTGGGGGALIQISAEGRSQTGLMMLRTRNVGLTPAPKMENPWVDASDCYQSNVNDCSCGGWTRWMGSGGYTPVPCVKNTLASIYALAKFVDSKGYKLYLGGGSLLGAMRCGTFIPWDYDADFGVDTPSEQEAQKLRSEIDAWAGGSQKPSSVWVTIFGGLKEWHSRNPKATKSGNTHMDGSVSVGKPDNKLIPCVLNDIVLHCPANYNEVLTSKYGSDWKATPKRWKSWSENKLGEGLKLDEARLDACENRMSSIDAALANMK